MIYTIQFQYKGENDLRPFDYALNDEEIEAPDGKTISIPNVGDSVTLTTGGKTEAYMVVSRHFSYSGDDCYINIVVSDISEAEMGARLKE